MKKPAGKRGARRAAPDPAVHAIADELTIYRVADLRASLLEALGRGVRQFDLGGVTECDSAGLQMLLALRRSVQDAGGACRFDPVSEPVRSLAALFDVETILCAKA